MEVFNALGDYAEKHSFQESEALRKIVETTKAELEYADMIAGPQVVGLLKLLIQVGGFSKILEVGMFTGYSAMAMAEELPEGGLVTTLEMNEKYLKIAERCFADNPHRAKINIKFGNARKTALEVNGPYDMIFLDADKQFYPGYFTILKPKLRRGGIFVVDNVFWGGEVLDRTGRKAQAIHKLNEMILEDRDMEPVMLTVRDGLLLARKKLREEIKP